MTGETNIQFLPPQNQDQLTKIMAIQRAQQLAESMQANAAMPDPNATAGGITYRHSPLEYLARAGSGAIANRESLQAKQMQMQLLGQQMQGMQGGTPGVGGGTAAGTTAGLSQAQLYQGAWIAKTEGPEAAKAYFDNISLTNEQKNSTAGLIPPTEYKTTGGGSTYLSPQAANAMANGGTQPGSPSTGFGLNANAPPVTPPPVIATPPAGNTAPAPGPVGATPLAGSNSPNVPLPYNGPAPSAPPGPAIPLRPAGTPAAMLPALSRMDNPPAAVSAAGDQDAAVMPNINGNNPTPVRLGTPGIAEKGALDAVASGQKTLSDADATNLAEAQKSFNTMYSNLGPVSQRLANMSKYSKLASSGYGVNNDNDAWKQSFDKTGLGQKLAPGVSDANGALKQLTDQAILPEIGPQLQQGNMKGNKFVETLASGSSGIDLSDPDSTRQLKIGGLGINFANLMKAQAETIRKYGGQVPSDDVINHKIMAQQAIAQGADPAKVQALFTQQTGQPWQ